jgi:hypothetical protein
MRGRAHSIVQRFFERCTAQQHAFLRARFILMTQLEPEQVGPELDDPELEQRMSDAVRELEQDVERLEQGARRMSSTTLKPLKK